MRINEWDKKKAAKLMKKLLVSGKIFSFTSITEENVAKFSKKILFITSPNERLHAHNISKPFRVLISKIYISKLMAIDIFQC